MARKDALMFSLLWVVCWWGATVEGTSENPANPYDFLYKEGVDRYLENDWEGCVKNLEEAIADWHWWFDSTTRCRKNCYKKSAKEDLFAVNLTEDDRFFERIVRNTLCVVKCKKDVFGSRMDRVVEKHVTEDFEMRKPYDYLQLCLYKLGRVNEAADAAATVLAAQPDHEVMTNNLQYYVTELSVEQDSIVNMELKPYGKNYIKGTQAYEAEDYKKTVELMEESLVQYYEAYEDCRFLCEDPFNQGWYPDFVSSVANHFTFTLRCKRRCTWELSDLYGEINDDFFASYFNYLQFSYFKLGNMEKASEAVESYLTISPEDESQNRNKQFYITSEGVDEALFVPRQDVVAFKEREDIEEKVMDFIETNFAFLTYKDDDDEMELTSPATDSSNSSSVAGVDATTVTLAADTTKLEL